MIQVKADIEVADTSKKVVTVELSPSNIGKNNVSTSLPPVNKKSKGSSAWIIGYSKIGEPHSLEDSVANGGNVDYYISKKLSQKGYFLDPDGTPLGIGFKLTFNEPVNNITIVFDTQHNIFPKNSQISGYNVDGDYFSELISGNDDPIWTIQLEHSYVDMTCTFNNLNVVNRQVPLIVQGVYTGANINLTIDNLLNLDINHNDRSRVGEPSFGVYSNKGNISFIDIDGEIKDYIEEKMLVPNQKVVIQLVDTKSNKSNVIGKYRTTKWEYDNNNRIVNVDISDDLTDLQDILIPSMPLEVSYNTTIGKILDYLLASVPNLPMDYEPEAMILLNKIMPQYFYINSSNLWNELQKLCNVCGLHIFRGNNGELRITSEYGVVR